MSSYRQNLYVPYAEKDAAKALGAKWDPHQKTWYAPSHDLYVDKLSKWHSLSTTPTSIDKKHTVRYHPYKPHKPVKADKRPEWQVGVHPVKRKPFVIQNGGMFFGVLCECETCKQYREKDAAKAFGAKWDPQQKKWYR